MINIAFKHKIDLFFAEFRKMTKEVILPNQERVGIPISTFQNSIPSRPCSDSSFYSPTFSIFTNTFNTNSFSKITIRSDLLDQIVLKKPI